MTVNSWTSVATTYGAGTYDWNSPSNWSLGVAPSHLDDALFPATSGNNPYEVTINPSGGADVQDVVVNDANFDLYLTQSSGALTVERSFTLNFGTLSLDESPLNIGNGSDGLDGTLVVGGSVVADGQVINGGAIQIFNTSGGAGLLQFNGGTVFAVTGATDSTLEIYGQVEGTGNFQIAANATLALDSSVVGTTSAVTFDGAGATFADNSEGALFGAVITSMTLSVAGFAGGTDQIEIENDLSASATLTGSVLNIYKGDGSVDTFSLTGDTYTGDTTNDGTNTFFVLEAVCFAAGTRIRTEAGERLVEDLKEGDRVAVTQDGEITFQPVKWVGHRTIDLTRHPRPRFAAPIRIVRGAIAENLPVRDLVVSPDHCLFLDGKLIPAKLLINGMTIRQEIETRSVTYYHVEMERHCILLAEGVAAESYLDTGNRAFFSNAGLALILHPEFHVNAGLRRWESDACAPLTVRPDAVLPVWRPIADRAVALGHTPPEFATTTDADLHLLADGRRIDTIAIAGDTHSFLVPAGVQSLVLASRSVVPHELTPYLDDPRQIGVSVRHIVMRGRTDRVEFSPDHPSLARGWHAAEKAEGALWRWTLGQGALPVGVVDGPMILEITVASTTTYRIDEPRLEGRLAA